MAKQPNREPLHIEHELGTKAHVRLAKNTFVDMFFTYLFHEEHEPLTHEELLLQFYFWKLLDELEERAVE